MKVTKLAGLAGISALAICGMSAPAHAQAGTQFIGQVSPFAGTYCPREWTEASGQLLPISQYTALFAILGTTYGGDGRTTLGLPDLRGRTPIGEGTGPGLGTFPLGSKSGTTQFTLIPQNLPSHTHGGTIKASPNLADTGQPVRNTLALSNGAMNYLDNDPPTNNMHPNTISVNNAGGGQAVDKRSPFTTIRWCIALTGIFPSRN